MNKTKFLGIIIEEHLNWATHINHLCNIIARNVGILQVTIFYSHSYVLKILYHSLILSPQTIAKTDIMTFAFMYKLKNNKLPSMIPHTFITKEHIHSHNTRNKEGYLILSVRTNCRKFTVSYAGPILWNSFPQQLRQLPSEALFKKKIKSTLLATYWITHYN